MPEKWKKPKASMELSDRQRQFLDFVKAQHGDQKRKYTFEPYWTHVYAVAELVAPYEPEGIEIAFGHDLLEDTDCTFDELYRFLSTHGYSPEEALLISNGVKELTDVYTWQDHKDKNRKERKKLEAERLGTISPLAQSVKYADLTHNMQSIVQEDKDFARVFLKEKRAILNLMRAGNIDLLVLCCHTLKEAMLKLGG